MYKCALSRGLKRQKLKVQNKTGKNLKKKIPFCLPKGSLKGSMSYR
jgi:hypothetical protein